MTDNEDRIKHTAVYKGRSLGRDGKMRNVWFIVSDTVEDEADRQLMFTGNKTFSIGSLYPLTQRRGSNSYGLPAKSQIILDWTKVDIRDYYKRVIENEKEEWLNRDRRDMAAKAALAYTPSTELDTAIMTIKKEIDKTGPPTRWRLKSYLAKELF